MIEPRTVVLTCIKLRLKTLPNFKFLFVYFEQVIVKNLIKNSKKKVQKKFSARSVATLVEDIFLMEYII